MKKKYRLRKFKAKGEKKITEKLALILNPGKECGLSTKKAEENLGKRTKIKNKCRGKL